VYEVSALSYKGLAFGGDDQSILVSGESGAGKTETVKIAMNHMASVQKGPSKAGDSGLDPVVQRVVDSNPLLEAFGNAKTRRNDNSSRFGKYLQLQFDNSEAGVMAFGDKSESKCKLAGSICEVYLLEKNRIIGHDTEERTYHMFYQLLAAPDSVKSEYWSKLKGTNFDSFKYIGNTKTTKIEGKTDAQHFEDTVNTLAMVGVSGQKLKDMMRAICAVLQLGNLTFKAKGDDGSQCSSPSEMRDLANLLNIPEDQITLAFTERTMKTRTETYKVPLKTDAAKEAADALAKEIYGKVFLWVVDQINEATDAVKNYKNGSMSKFGIIGMLDIFGFESFQVNRFEQLCINYANEKLQQKFTEDIFRSVQAEYEAEGIELAEIWYDDNTDVLDLIEGRSGLLALLNEECVRPKGTDFDYVQKALQQNKNSPCLITNKLDRTSFGIHHYAGKVMYDAVGFVSSNQETLPTDLEDLCAKSDNPLVSATASAPAAAPASRSGGPRRQKSNLVAPTVWGKYKTQLASLMANLRKTNSRYIRCIKPNMKKVPVIMEHMATVEQLRCAGVVAAVTLSRSAFPNRLENSVVRFRYSNMWDPKAFPSKRNSSMSAQEGVSADIDAMMTCALKPKEEEIKGKIVKAFVVGKTRTYFRAGALEYLEANRLESGLDAPAINIQRVARGWLVRKSWLDRLKEAANAEKEKKAEEERKRLEALAKKRAAEEAKRKAELKRQREEKARKEREERERREREEELERQRKEREEQLKLEKEEKEAKKLIKGLKNEIKELEHDLESLNRKNLQKLQRAEDEIKRLEEEKAELEAEHSRIMAEAATIDKAEIAANKKKIEESEKITGYLKSQNKKVREQTEKMKEDLQDLKEQNNRLIEANASAGASLDSLEKQKKNIAAHNTKLDENIKKWKSQNQQLKADLENRTAYYRAETKIRAEYERTMEKIIEMMEAKCDDPDLIEEVSNAQMQCEALAAQKGGSSPGLMGSDVSDN
jgi:myosin-5